MPGVTMVNRDYEPTAPQEQILRLLKEGRDSDNPWGYTTPAHIRQELDLSKGNTNFHLRQLESAGWIEKAARGLYRFVEDPREAENNE